MRKGKAKKATDKKLSKHSKHKGHGQSAVEYITSYGWALLILGVVAALLYVFVLAPSNIVPDSCTFSNNLYCNDLVASANSVTGAVNYVFLLSNTNQYPVTNALVTVQLNGGNTSQTSCIPSFIAAGGTILCTATSQTNSKEGQTVNGKIYVSVTQCTGLNVVTNAQCQGVPQTYVGTFYSRIGGPQDTNISILLYSNPVVNNNNVWTDNLTTVVKFAGQVFKGATLNFTTSNSEFTINPPSINTNVNGSAPVIVKGPLTPITNTIITSTFGGVSNSITITPPFTAFLYIDPNASLVGNTISFTINWTTGIPKFTAAVYYSATPTCITSPSSFVLHALRVFAPNSISNPHGVQFSVDMVGNAAEEYGLYAPGTWLCAIVNDSSGNTATTAYPTHDTILATSNVNSSGVANLTMPSGYTSYLCSAGNTGTDFLSSWTADSGTATAHVGRQKSDNCLVSTPNSLSGQGMAGLGIFNGLLLQSVQNFNSSLQNTFSYNYNVNSNNGAVVIAIACGSTTGYDCTSITLPTGCAILTITPGSAVSRFTDGDSTALIGTCNPQNAGSYTITGATAYGMNINVAASVYVFKQGVVLGQYQ